MGMAIAGRLAISSAGSRDAHRGNSSARAVLRGQYADDFGALSAQARDFDHRPEATFSYCMRNTAVYECLSYASDGAVRRDRRRRSAARDRLRLPEAGAVTRCC